MNRFVAPRLIYISCDIGLALRCLTVRIPEKLIPASLLFAKRLFLHVQLSLLLVNVCLGHLTRQVFPL